MLLLYVVIFVESGVERDQNLRDTHGCENFAIGGMRDTIFISGNREQNSKSKEQREPTTEAEAEEKSKEHHHKY